MPTARLLKFKIEKGMGQMKITSLMAGAVAVSLLGTGCATKKYVAKTIAPVEQRVTGTENKNAEQDKTIATQGTEISELDHEPVADQGKAERRRQ